MSYHKEILEKLSDRTITYLRDDLGLSDGLCENYSIITVESIEYHDSTVFISLTNDITGTVGMSITNEFSFDIAKAFVFGDMEDDEILELASESVSEVLNVTLGNILNDLKVMQEGGKVNISPPKTLSKSVCVKRKKDGEMYLVTIGYKDTTIILSYFI